VEVDRGLRKARLRPLGGLNRVRPGGVVMRCGAFVGHVPRTVVSSEAPRSEGCPSPRQSTRW
jgi:hypothetical protein